MYRNFFSLSDLPFSISPDPRYLFMSDRHKEALAHLTYGLGGSGLAVNGGFILLTGEVGTGKTTISRCLMEQLPENTQVASILNPTLSSQELLATLCDELQIIYKKRDASLKSLTDRISHKLLKNHENDINTLLIIDEAQHLQPEVLEQLRLLTNLETNTKKLLQVILIGQPELQQLLQRRDLRQLAQRITARYHLMPLTKPELNQYIQYRLSVAGCVRSLFDKRALNKVHQLSQGVPRLINLLCHNALMLAYNQNDSVVNRKTVVAAAERALGEPLTNKQERLHYRGGLIFSTALSIAALLAVAGLWWGERQTPVNELMVTNKQVQVSNTEEKLTAVVNSQDTLPTVLLSDNSAQTAVPTEKTVQKISALDEKVVSPKVVNHAEIQSKELKVAGVTKKIKQNKVDELLLVSANKPSLHNGTMQGANYQVTKVAGVSNDFLARFQAAIDETETENKEKNDPSTIEEQPSNELNATKSLIFDESETTSIKSLSQMPQQLQNSLPSLTFEQHIYSSDGHGWVNVNGRDRYEGDMITAELQVSKILPQQVILRYRDETFSLPALTNW